MFKLKKKLENGVRIGELETPHGMIETPFFMPVGTVGSVKAMAPWELEELGAQIVLSNTYHLYLRPGEKNIKELGGLHKFMNWRRPILTDSGGYQVFSLARGNNHNKKTTNVVPADDGASLVKITEEGILFKSHLDGSSHLFTPEKVIDIQLDLGVDILMPLDVCPSGTATREEVEESVRLTTLWADRSKKYFDRQVESRKLEAKSGLRPQLHGIVQGGLYKDLREQSARELMAIDFDGYSVGGLAVDFETRDMWEMVKLMGEILPDDKQRYLMGVGTPDDIIKATKLGMDMFDCVLPTRLARHGSVYVKSDGVTEGRSDGESIYKLINLLKSDYRLDGGVIDKKCNCETCRGSSTSLTTAGESAGFSRAYISHLLRSNEILGIRLTTIHNLHQYLELMRNIRSGQI